MNVLVDFSHISSRIYHNLYIIYRYSEHLFSEIIPTIWDFIGQPV